MTEDIFKILLWVCFGGWSLYLTTERGRLVDDIKTLKMQTEDIEKQLAISERVMNTSFWTKDDQLRFEGRMINSIDKLTDKIERLMAEHLLRCKGYDPKPFTDFK